MSDIIAQRIEQLRQAQGDPQAMALIALDFLLGVQNEPLRERLRAAIEAAAVVHWFNLPILAYLLNEHQDNTVDLFKILQTFPMVEPFITRETKDWNIHETTRFALRKRLLINNPERLRELSAHALKAIGDVSEPTLIAERLYHFFLVAPDQASDECEALYRDWADTDKPEIEQILRGILEELDQTCMVTGRARAVVLCVISWIRHVRGEFYQIEDLSRLALDLARDAGSPSTIGWALCLVGDINTRKGKIPTALENYQEALRIFENLARADLTNIAWQRDLASTCSRLGDIFYLKGQLDDAVVAYRKNLEISDQLYQREPKKPNWQCRRAYAKTQLGRALQSKGRVDESLTTFREALNIYQNLIQSEQSNTGNIGLQFRCAATQALIGQALFAKGQLDNALGAFQNSLEFHKHLTLLDPSNFSWQISLADVYRSIGDVLSTKGQIDDALVAFHKDLEISERLAKLAPDNPIWQHQGATAQTKMGDTLLLKGHVDEALAFFQSALKIFETLTKLDPANAVWQRDLDVSQGKIGDALLGKNQPDEALVAFQKEYEISEHLVQLDPANLTWRRELAASIAKIGDALRANQHTDKALTAYRKSANICEELVQIDPANIIWQREFAVALAKIAEVLPQDHSKEALQIIFKSNEITKKLVQIDPANAVWQLDLALSYLRIAHVRRQTGNYGNAVSFNQKTIAIIRRLSSADPSFAHLQRELANALDSLATLQAQRHKHQARETICESLQILSQLVQQHPDHARWINDLEITKQHSEELHGKKRSK